MDEKVHKSCQAWGMTFVIALFLLQRAVKHKAESSSNGLDFAKTLFELRPAGGRACRERRAIDHLAEIAALPSEAELVSLVSIPKRQR